MINYEIAPAILEPYLPPGTELDFFKGKTYVSLVGFLFSNTKIFGCPIPFAGTFEEVNLRFYVVRNENNQRKRGVVFINESVPLRLVANVANKLYKEHYTALPMRHKFVENENFLRVSYGWKKSGEWFGMEAEADKHPIDFPENGKDEFIFEHYYGYTKINDLAAEEYFIEHPRWKMHTIRSIKLQCNFEKMYGKPFAFLNHQQPSFSGLAAGSSISVKWKRRRFEKTFSGRPDAIIDQHP